MVVDRYLGTELARHLDARRQMLFLSGPRQVGKTTLAKRLRAARGDDGVYLDWDNEAHRRVVLDGTEAVARHVGLDRLHDVPRFCAFDELHKYRRWRDFLKGLFDTYEDDLRILVTGSARLDLFGRGGDSLTGRYFPYTLHPFSVAELVGSDPAATSPTGTPRPLDDERWEALLRFGGFPEPFLAADTRFHRRWRALRTRQLLREDLRDLTRVQEIGQIESFAERLRAQVGQLTSYTSLARDVRVSIDTARRWSALLESLCYCFAVRPWSRNVARALRKEPKYYLWDWSAVDDAGARLENLVAGALRKATDWWTQSGRGDFSLHFLRDKERREVDFLVARDGEPWFLVEVKTSGRAPLSEELQRFQAQTEAAHAFQLAGNLPFVERDCFGRHEPVIVPARTLLSQLV